MVALEQIVGSIPVVGNIVYGTFGAQIQEHHVIGLGLYSKGLTSLPETIGDLNSLRHLDLRQNYFTYLPETIGQLRALRVFYLNENQITTLPEMVGDLTSLEELYLNENNLPPLPESIRKPLETHGCKIYQ
jgi:Leucine-rich repeat (LRR) protein